MTATKLKKLTKDGISVELIQCTRIPKSESTLLTVVTDYPKYIDAQVNMHKMFSRSASSSRAVPSKKVRDGKVPMWTPTNVGFNWIKTKY